jgi:hypothetical protein
MGFTPLFAFPAIETPPKSQKSLYLSYTLGNQICHTFGKNIFSNPFIGADLVALCCGSWLGFCAYIVKWRWA